MKAQDDALQGCMAENGWNDCANNECKDEILSVLCKDEYETCVPPGELTCKEINDCINSCPEETFQQCASDCISDGSTEGQDQYGAFADCAIGNGFNDCANAQCQNDVIQDFCSTEYDTCNEATGTCSDEMQELTLASFKRLWGRVMSTDEVIAELKESAAVDILANLDRSSARLLDLDTNLQPYQAALAAKQ